jgi:hypothetical protein
MKEHCGTVVNSYAARQLAASDETRKISAAARFAIEMR